MRVPNRNQNIRPYDRRGPNEFIASGRNAVTEPNSTHRLVRSARDDRYSLPSFGPASAPAQSTSVIDDPCRCREPHQPWHRHRQDRLLLENIKLRRDLESALRDTHARITAWADRVGVATREEEAGIDSVPEPMDWQPEVALPVRIVTDLKESMSYGLGGCSGVDAQGMLVTPRLPTSEIASVDAALGDTREGFIDGQDGYEAERQRLAQDTASSRPWRDRL